MTGTLAPGVTWPNLGYFPDDDERNNASRRQNGSIVYRRIHMDWPNQRASIT